MTIPYFFKSAALVNKDVEVLGISSHLLGSSPHISQV
jgi:hypothetical protein